MKVLLIIPAYNEEENILRTIASIETFKQEVTHFQHELDYVVINDGSTDGTKQILEANQINAIHLVLNLGIGGAVQTGYKYALEMSMMLRFSLMVMVNMISIVYLFYWNH